MLQYLVVTALGEYAPRQIEQISKAMADCGCNINDCRTTILGAEFSMLMLASGSWDAIAKIEQLLPKLAPELGLTIQLKRSKLRKPAGKLMPYAIDVICADRPKVVHDITKFFADNAIEIQELCTSTYKASHTETQMFSLHMTINIPTDTSISTLRGEFLEFCDRLNLDAIMEPVK